jgi:hypothetical protein
MEHSPSWEADSCTAAQYISDFMKPEYPLPCSQEPVICPYRMEESKADTRLKTVREKEFRKSTKEMDKYI